MGALPGVRMPLKEVRDYLSRVWSTEVDSSGDRPSEFRASQLNLILHFGITTPESEAKATFQTALDFSQRYPCRIIVLCPQEAVPGERILDAKDFSQCYVGRSRREMICCDALLLGYPRGDSAYLESAVSVWLDNDLPVYHWIHRLPVQRIKETYPEFLAKARRVIFDRSVDPKAGQAIIDSEPIRQKRDLAYCRTLPIRQSLGQLLSRFPASDLAEGLAKVEIEFQKDFRAEAEGIARWIDDCLKECAAEGDRLPAAKLSPLDAGEVDLSVALQYEGGDELVWKGCLRAGRSSFHGQRKGNGLELSLGLKPLSGTAALSEALFF
jgi:hypothetical protein